MIRVFGVGFIIIVSVHGFQIIKFVLLYLHVSSCYYGLVLLAFCIGKKYSLDYDLFNFIESFNTFLEYFIPN